MNKLIISPYNVIDGNDLPQFAVDKTPEKGDPLEIDNELYFVCDLDNSQTDGQPKIGVIPLVVRNPANVKNIKEYINCLSIAHRRVQFKNSNRNCDFEGCDEMHISK